MTEAKKRTITPDTRLQVIALVVSAGQKVVEAARLERAVAKLIGAKAEYDDHIRDLLYTRDGVVPSVTEIDEALERCGVSIEGDPLADEATKLVEGMERADEGRAAPVWTEAADMIRKLLADRVRP